MKLQTRNAIAMTALLAAALTAPQARGQMQITLGSAGHFAMLANLTTANATIATVNASINLNNSTVNGDLGAPTITGAAANQYNGNVYTANNTQPAGTLKGTYFPISASTINAAAADAITASHQLAGLTPTQTITGDLNGQTIVGNGDTNVITVTGSITGGFQVKGGPNDIFVFNVLGTLNMTTGTAGANASGSTVTPSQIIYNFIGLAPGQTVSTATPGTVNGTMLSVNGNYIYALDSVANGQAIDLFNGATAITGLSAEVQNGTGNFFVGVSAAVPEPPSFTMAMLVAALFAGVGVYRRRRSRTAAAILPRSLNQVAGRRREDRRCP
jgi:hypothetical protein